LDAQAFTSSRSTVPDVGMIEWFTPGDYEHVERVLADMRVLSVQHLRTGISWSDFDATNHDDWYEWLFKRLAREICILPCFVGTPEAQGVEPKQSAPPRDPTAYSELIEAVIRRFGRSFEWVELWNEPNNLYDWDWRLDPDWRIFSEMAGSAAQAAHRLGKKAVLAGMCPTDLNWLRMMFRRGVMEAIDAVGVHGFPGTWEFDWQDWCYQISKVRRVLAENGSRADIWITKTGFSTWRHDEHQQLRAFIAALQAPVSRVYWYAARDLHPDLPAQDGFHVDERHYHFGLKRADATPKLLFRLWAAGGLTAVREAAELGKPQRVPRVQKRPVLITGGCGFVGANLAHRLLKSGKPVLLYDNLSRAGVEQNLRWLREQHGARLQIEIGDVRDRYALRRAVQAAEQVFHFAAQVAVTTSLLNPTEDFAINALGTLNLLEELRALKHPPPLVLTSTNKVYGSLQDVELTSNLIRYEPADERTRARGISEERPLDLHSPYGCSKGVADQYVLDYARTFGLPAVVFRMSCIYGPHQFGNEDQGWVAYFLIRAIEGHPITIYGDGMQVRDVLYVRDLVDAFILAQKHMESIAGRAFNIGGGPANAISLLELLDLIGEIRGVKPVFTVKPWRVGDQQYYVSDTASFRTATGWHPKVPVRRGVEALHQWLVEHRFGSLSEKQVLRRRDEIRPHQSPVVVHG
jgi:CDP-paratose 2-epimerase